MENKLLKLRDRLREQGMDGMLVTNLINIKYLSNFNGSNAVVYINHDELYFFTDFRYKTVANEVVNENFNIKIIDRNLSEVSEVLKDAKKIAVEDSMSLGEFKRYNTLTEAILVETNSWIEELRMVKTVEEVVKIKNSIDLICDATKFVIDNIVPNETTEKDVALMLYNYGMTNGASAFSFDPIVASGTNGALPHADYSDKLICDGEFVTIDAGYIYSEYCSDITRTILIGDEPENAEMQKIYDIVLKANQLAIDAIKPGMRCCDVDAIARDYIAEHGYGEYFGHGLGHGFGLEVHEMPYFNTTDTTVLVPGMVMTVEPGIYVPGLGGVRIEDDIIVTEDGCNLLTKRLDK